MRCRPVRRAHPRVSRRRWRHCGYKRSHRPYDEAFKRAAFAQWQSGVPASRVAEGLGITAESLRAWRRQFGGADAIFTVTLSAAQPRDVIVNFTIKGSATNGTDYTLIKDTVKIKAGKTSKSIKIARKGTWAARAKRPSY